MRAIRSLTTEMADILNWQWIQKVEHFFTREQALDSTKERVEELSDSSQEYDRYGNILPRSFNDGMYSYYKGLYRL